MIKLRSPYLCNLKGFLLFLVVFGHALEKTGQSAGPLYRFLYLFHMPLFVFLSGLHLKTEDACLRSARSSFRLYLCIQGLIVCFCFICGTPASLLVPYWHLWYLLSLGLWSVFALLVCRILRRFPHSGFLLLTVSAAAALVCGLLPLGRWLSLSRTLTFFPYLLLGILCPLPPERFFTAKRRFFFSLCGFLILIVVLPFCMRVPVSFLYRADPYTHFGYSALQGLFSRAACFFAAFGCGLLLLSFTPARRTFFCGPGSDTLPVYLLHTLPLPFLSAFWPGQTVFGLALFSFTELSILWSLLRWYRPLYSVTLFGWKKESG